jgi:hypothetical protein
MKTRSQLNALSIEDHAGHRESARLLWSASLTAGATILLCTLINSEVSAVQPDFCRQTSQDALTSCRAGADSDYSLALGKCDNLADPAARASCQNQALADRNDARQTCNDQYDVRQAACTRLGAAPYDPVIDPSNFVTRVDNPYFPLTPGTTFIYEGHTAQGFDTMSSP